MIYVICLHLLYVLNGNVQSEKKKISLCSYIVPDLSPKNVLIIVIFILFKNLAVVFHTTTSH